MLSRPRRSGASVSSISSKANPPVGDAQNAIFDEFGVQPTQFGKTYAQLMSADPDTLSGTECALRSQIFDQAEQLAIDLRDYWRVLTNSSKAG